MLQTPCFAKDVIVEFIEENYNEIQSNTSYSPLIYHSLQVRSEAGPKLLVLTGDNSHYRKWLRQYIAQDKAFIIKVPDNQNDLFLSSNTFEINVMQIHPFNLSLYRKGEEKSKKTLKQYMFEKDRRQETKEIIQESRQELDQKKTEKALIEQGKQQAAAAQRNALEKSNQSKEEETKRVERGKLLKSLIEQQAAEQLKLREELEQKIKDQELLFSILAAQRADDQKRRKEELEQRWLELKTRLLADERIKGLDQEARGRELETRWMELRQRFEQE